MKLNIESPTKNNGTELSIDDFSLLNKDARQVLYRKKDDPSINLLTLSFINNTGTDVTLKGGVPSNPGLLTGRKRLLSSKENGSTFNFDFQSLLSLKEAEGLDIDLPDAWEKVFFAGNKDYPPSWSMAPQKDITVKANDQIKFVIRKVTCTQTAPATCEILYSNIPDIPDPGFPLVFHLAVQNPSDEKKKDLQLLLQTGYTDVVHPINGITTELRGDVPVPIYITYDPKALIENGFTFLLTNTSNEPLVPSKIASSDSPVLYISFLFGNAYYTITTQELADNGKITIDVSAAVSTWKTAGHTASTSYWKFLPESSFVMARNETVKFILHKIITPLNVNAGDISTMYIQFNNVPEFNDACYTLLLEKRKAAADVKNFTATSREIKFGDNVALSWATELARRVTLEYADRDKTPILLDSDKGEIGLNEISFKAPIPPTAWKTKFILTAYGSGDQKTSSDLDINLEEPIPSITSFTASPSLVDVNKAENVFLTWKTQNSKEVTLELFGKQVTSPRNGGSDPIRITTASEFMLRATSYGDSAPDVKKTRVYAYKKHQPLKTRAGSMETSTMQPMPTMLFDNDKRFLYVLNAPLKTVARYDRKDSRLVNQNTATAMALSCDGSRLFVYNSTSAGGVTMIKTDSNESSNTYQTLPVTLMLPTPDMTKLYCLSTEGSHTFLKTINIDVRTNTLSEGRRWLSFFNGFGSMIFNEDASKLFLLTSNSVELRNVSDDSLIDKRLLMTSRGANDFVHYNDKEKLYVSCSESNHIVVMNTKNLRAIYKINVGRCPSKLLLSRNGSCLYVANFGSNTISIIDTTTDSVVSTLTVGNNPIAMALSDENNVLFVANYSDKSVSVIDLDMSVVLTPALSTGEGGNPIDIVACYDENEYMRIYVAKEIYPQRTPNSNPGTANMDVAVYSVKKPH